MQKRGYRLSILRKKLQHHLKLWPDTYGDVNAMSLYKDIQRQVQALNRLDDWEVDSKDWTGWVLWTLDDEELEELVEEELSSAESDLSDSE
jgi:hypothetical protein